MDTLNQDESLDPRVRRTRAALIDAVLALASERDFNDIGVSEIARAAGVSRAAFYLHYKDKHEVVVAALDSLFEQLTQDVTQPHEMRDMLTSVRVPASFIRQLTQIKSRAELYRRLLDDTGSSAFSARLRRHFQDQGLRVWNLVGIQATPGSRPLELRAAVTAGAGISGIRWWLENGDDISIEQIADWLWKQTIAVNAFTPEELGASRGEE